MRNAATILGIIGGVVGMAVGFFGYGFAELWAWLSTQMQQVEVSTGLGLAEEAEPPNDPLVTQALALASPILGITGGAMASGSAGVAAVLLAASAAGMFYGFGFGVFTMFPIAMCALAALMAALAAAFGRSADRDPRR